MTITHNGGVVICEAPATGTADAGSTRPYPACELHATDAEEATA